MQADLEQHIQVCSLQLQRRLQGASEPPRFQLDLSPSSPLALTLHAHDPEPGLSQPALAPAADVEASQDPEPSMPARHHPAASSPAGGASSVPEAVSAGATDVEPAHEATAVANSAPGSTETLDGTGPGSAAERVAAAADTAAQDEGSAMDVPPATEQPADPLVPAADAAACRPSRTDLARPGGHAAEAGSSPLQSDSEPKAVPEAAALQGVPGSPCAAADAPPHLV